MFTGIVEELGTVESVELREGAARLVVRGPIAVDGTKPGDSIAVNGCCLTAVELTPATFAADVVAETLDRTSLGALAAGDRVNLERPVTLADRLGGHLVQGHVDGTARVVERVPATGGERVRVELPADLARYVVEKGSITVDGVSLTVAAVDAGTFTVALIPATLEHTTLGLRTAGDVVNLEVDVLAKYVERLLGQTGPPPGGERQQ